MTEKNPFCTCSTLPTLRKPRRVGQPVQLGEDKKRRLGQPPDNDYDDSGLALIDEFCDAISACIEDPGEECAVARVP